MFSLTVIDHVRLDSEHVAQNYTIHARAADRLSQLSFWFRMSMALLLTAAAAACIINLLMPARFYQVTAAVTTSIAAVGFALYSVIGLEGRVNAHRALGHKLWLVSERYRSLIAEADQGLVASDVLLQRRDRLIEDVHAIYERGFAADQPAFESARLPAIPGERAA